MNMALGRSCRIALTFAAYALVFICVVKPPGSAGKSTVNRVVMPAAAVEGLTGRLTIMGSLRRALADGSPGSAEAGQRIWVHAPPPAYCGRSLWTDADGRFTAICEGLPDASPLVIEVLDASGSRMLEWRRIYRLADGDSLAPELLLPYRSDPVPTPSPTPADATDGWVEGQVLIGAGARPAAGALVRVEDRVNGVVGAPVLTDALGRFELRQGHSAISAMELAAYLPGFAPTRQRHEGSPSSPSPGVGKGFLLRLAAAEEPEPLVLRPAADTWYEYLGGATGAPIRPGGHGDDPVLEASFQDTGVNEEVLLRFDPPREAMGRRLDRAELWLVVTAASSAGLDLPRGAGEVALTVGRLGEAWDEAQADGLHRPARVNLPVRTLARAGPVTVDVSETVQAWLDGAAAHGFALRASSTIGAPILAVARFGSRESAFPPALVIHWAAAPTPETATPGTGGPTATMPTPTAGAIATSTPSPHPAMSRTVYLPLVER